MRKELAALLLQGIAWTGPRLTPQEAAAVMAKVQSPANRTGVVAYPSTGPTFAVLPYSPPNPAALLDSVRRLDGSRRDQQPRIYGPSVVVTDGARRLRRR